MVFYGCEVREKVWMQMIHNVLELVFLFVLQLVSGHAEFGV